MTHSRTPLVSVVIPTHGRPVTLRRAVESVLRQTYASHEVIVVDDNDPLCKSRALTETVMCDYRRESNVTYVVHQENRNGAAARNTGIEQAGGEFIAFLDDDDWFLPQKLEQQVNLLLQDSSADAASCGWIHDERLCIPGPLGDPSRELLMMDYRPITSTLMFRRDVLTALEGFDESFTRHQDLELMLRFFQRYKLGFVPESLVELGSNDGSNAVHGRELDELKKRFFEHFAGVMDSLEAGEPGVAHRIRSRHYARAFLNHLHRGHVLLAMGALRRSATASRGELSREVCRTTRAFVLRRWRAFRTSARGGIDDG